MIIGTRKNIWPWPADVGVNRDFINGFWVEWSGTKPTDQEVSDHCAPTPDIIAGNEKQSAKQPDRSPQGRRDRAAYRVLLRASAKHNALVALLAGKGALTAAEAASVRLSVTTLEDFQAAVAAEIDNGPT